jgi:transcriptional regulator with XRE-family HTH domain
MAYVNEEYTQAFSENLKRLIKAKNLTIQQIASASPKNKKDSFDRSNLRRIIKGKGNITLSKLFQLAKGMNVHPKELLDFDFNGQEGSHVKKE